MVKYTYVEYIGDKHLPCIDQRFSCHTSQLISCIHKQHSLLVQEGRNHLKIQYIDTLLYRYMNHSIHRALRS